MIYAGPLGRNSHKLVQYFEASLPFIICFPFTTKLELHIVCLHFDQSLSQVFPLKYKKNSPNKIFA